MADETLSRVRRGPRGKRGHRGHRGRRGHDGDTGATGPTGFVGATTVAHPDRALNTTFQPSATRDVIGIYSVRIDSSLTLGSGGQVGRVELRSDAASPPTSVQCRVAGGMSGTVVIGVSLTDTVESVLWYLIPAGHNVNLTTVDETGTPTYALTSVTEITI